MENNFKRFLAMLLAVVMVIGMMPMNAFAAETERYTVMYLDTAAYGAVESVYVSGKASVTDVVPTITYGGGIVTLIEGTLYAVTIPADTLSAAYQVSVTVNGISTTLDPAAENMLYTLTGIDSMVSNGNTYYRHTGEWSVYTPAEEDTVIDTEAELIAAIAEGGMVTLGGNIEDCGTLAINRGVEVVLDLAGYELNFSAGVHMDNYGTLTIQDSGSTGKVTCDYYNGGIIYNTGDLTIYGGAFTTNYLADQSNTATTVIYGGTFAHVESAAYIAEGYVAEDNGDGTWTVREASDEPAPEECEHNTWDDGECYVCGKVCEHEGNSWNSETYTCMTCGSECTHVWGELHCTICQKPCEECVNGKHGADGFCTVCTFHVGHDFQEDNTIPQCYTCGAENPGFVAAKVGEETYSNLQAAIDAASDGGTVTLLNNIELYSSLNSENSGLFNIAEAANVTIDLNGKTILIRQKNVDFGHFTLFYNYGNLTITDSGTGGYAGVYVQYANGYDNVIVNHGGNLTINGGTLRITISYGSAGFSQVACVNNNASGHGDATLTINEGNVGSIIMTMGENANNVNITGGYVFDSGSVIGYTGDTTNTMLGAVNISGGEINGGYGISVSDNTTVTISGDPIVNAQLPDKNLILMGGTFSAQKFHAEDMAKFVAEGYVIDTSTPWPKVVKAETEIPNDTEEELAAALAAGGEVTLGGDIELTAPLTITGTVVLDLNGKALTYNSTIQNEAMITNKGNLTIKDTVGTGVINYNYTGAADSSYGKGNYTISNAGTLTVDGGEITIANLRGHAKYPINNNSTSADAELVINGGHLYNYNTCAIRQFCNSTTYRNSVTINGGLIEGYCVIWMQNPGKNTVNGQLTITGGEIRTTAAAYVNGTSALKDVSSRLYCTIDGEGGAWDEDSFVTITGGTFNENVYLATNAPAATVGEGATLNGRLELPEPPAVEVDPDVEIEGATEDEKDEIIKEIQNNTAVNDHDPVADNDEVDELDITFKGATVDNKVPSRLTYDVSPKKDGQKVSELTEEITFRLPVPVSVSSLFAKVFHNGSLFGFFGITSTSDGKYVEISSKYFSEYAVEFVDEKPVAMIGETGYATFAEAVAAIATDGSDTTIKILCDIELDSSVVFNYGAGDIIFTADEPVTIKQTKVGLDFDFTESADINIVVGENVTFEIYDNAAGMYVYYGPSMMINGTITGGQNWGCLYLYSGEHTVSETGKAAVGRIQLGYTELTVHGEVDTNYLLVENSTFTADGATVDANVIYDNNNGGQRWGESEFVIRNGSTVTTSKLTLSYADSVLSIDSTSKLTASTILGAGKIVIDATGMTAGPVTTIEGDASGFTGTIEVVGSDMAAEIVDGVITLVSNSVAKIGETGYATLAEAVAAANAAENGATIEVLSDITLSEKLTIKKNVTLTGEATITRGIAGTIIAVDKNATLTLDGGIVIDGGNDWTFDEANFYADLRAAKTLAEAKSSYSTSAEGGLESTDAMITISGTNGAVVMNKATIQNNWGSQLFSVPTGATLTMNEGTLIADIRGSVAGQLKGQWIVNGGKITGVHGHNTNGALTDIRGGTFTVNGGEICYNTLLGLNNNGSGTLAQVYGTGSKLIVNGGNIHDNSNFCPGGGWGSTVYLNRGGYFEMNGGTLEGGESDKCTTIGVNDPSSTVALNKGTIEVTDSSTGSYDSLLFGNVTIGEDMTVSGGDVRFCGTEDNTLVIDGTVNSDMQLRAENVTNNGTVNGDVTVTADSWAGFDGSVEISGGTWNGTFTEGDGAELTISGGTYKEDPSAFLDGEAKLDKLPDGTYGVISKVIEVSTKAELDAALAAAEEGDIIRLTADIDYGTAQLKIEKAITLDLGGNTLTTRNAYGGMSLKNNPTIKNGTIVHASNTAAIKAWNVAAFEDLVIDVQGKGDANKTIGGIVIQENAAGIDSIKNVTIKGEALTNGIETYNCGNATKDVIGSMENVTIDAKGTGMLISAPCGTATNCSISGGTNGIEIWIKGTYSASLDLVNSTVEGGVFAHDEFSSNPNITNNGTLSLTVDEATTGVDETDVTLTIARAEDGVQGILKDVMDNAEAKVNDTYYATLTEAMTAAQDNDKVTLLADLTLTEVVTIEKAITLNLNGKTLTGADGAIVLNIKAETTIRNGEITGNKSGTSSGLIDIYASLTMDGVTIETSKINALRFKAGNCTATLTSCDVTGAFKGYGGSVWVIQSGTYKASSTAINDQLNGTASISGGTFHYEIAETECAPGYTVVDNGDGTWTVKYAPVCFVDADNDGILDEGEMVYGSLEAVFANHQEGDVYVVLTADAQIADQVDTDADAHYYLNTNVTEGVNVKFLFADDWNYVQKMTIGKNVTLNAPYFLGWTDIDIYGTVNTTYAYFTGADVVIHEGGVLNVSGGDATVQVKNGAKLTVNGTVNTAILNVWAGASELVVSGADAKVNASWIDIWDGTPSVAVENGATLEVDKIKASRGGEITVEDATLDAGSIELGHNGESAGALTEKGESTISGEIKMTAAASTVNSDGGLNVTTDIAGHKVVYDEVNKQYKVVPKDYVAEVNGTQYETIQAAVEAAQDGETVILLADVALTEADHVANADRNVLIDVAGKDITLDMNGKTISLVHEDEFTNDYIVAVIRVADGAGLTVTGNGTIDVKALAENPDIAYMFWKRGTTGHLTIENGTFHMNDAADSMVYTNGNEIVNIKGGTWTLDAYGTRGNREPWIFNVAGAGDNHVTVTGGTFNADINRQFWSNEVLVPETYYTVDNGDGTWTVKEGAVAYINEGMLTGPYFVRKNIGYATIEEAIAAADPNDTITLLKDIEITETLDISFNSDFDKINITFNGNGHTIRAVGDAWNDGMWLADIAWNVTLNDVTFDGNNTGCKGVQFYTSQSTLNNVTIKNISADKWGFTDYAIHGNASELTVTGNLTFEGCKHGHMILGMGTNTGKTATTATVAEGATLSNVTIILDDASAALTAPAGLTIPTTVENCEVVYENGVYVVKEIKLFDLYGANMDLGNTLDMNFYFLKSHITDTGSYAVITKAYADKESVTLTIPMSEWVSQSTSLYKITFAGIAAKEMADDITVTIYDSNGKQISNVWEDSVRAYSMRMLQKATTDVERTVFVDMLNYGTEAQKYFKYNESDYANSQLTAEQQGYATVLDSLENNSRFDKSYYYGANMDLESSIKFNMYFVRSKVTADMTVEISYTDHSGNAHEIVVKGSQFFEQSKDLWKVTVDGLVVADVKQIITVVVKDASGNEVTTIVESIESYLARQSSTNALYETIMKFGLSANAYLHRNDK